MADDDFVPYIPSETVLPELTVKAVLLGALLSMIMAAANAYLGLYAGMTVSATIPAAVISLAVFRALIKAGVVDTANILETNLAKTMASAGESLAAGVIFTIPALLVVGLWSDIDITKTAIIAFIGGTLGVLFTISLRRVLIVDLALPYPEGVACTEVLKVSEKGGRGIYYVFSALGLASLYKFTSSGFGLHLFEERVSGVTSAAGTKFFGGADLSPALLSVGYIVGLRIASFIFMGGVLGWVIIAPTIGALQGFPEASTEIDSFVQLWSEKVRYIGVGAMVVGGLYTIFRMRNAIVSGVRQAFSGKREKATTAIRTELDISLRLTWILIFLFVFPIFAIYMWVTHNLLISTVSSVVMLVAAFVFTAIAGYIAGVVGSSNNPISGVTVATVLFAALLLVNLGAAGESGMTSTILIAALVCSSAAIAGDVMQDLKTGQLLGSTPRNLQIAEFMGVAAAALVIAPVLVVLNNAYTIGSPDLPAPQAFLMGGVTKGVFKGGLPFEMVLLGAFIAFVLIVLHIPVMSVAIGIYLPFTLSVPIFLGGLLRHGVECIIENRVRRESEFLHPDEVMSKIKAEKEKVSQKGILFSSGLIAGEAIMGVIVATIAIAHINLAVFTSPSNWPGILVFMYFLILLGYISLRDYLKGRSFSDVWDDLWAK